VTLGPAAVLEGGSLGTMALVVEAESGSIGTAVTLEPAVVLVESVERGSRDTVVTLEPAVEPEVGVGGSLGTAALVVEAE